MRKKDKEFLMQVATYFDKLAVETSEDSVYWAMHSNAERLRRIASNA